ncbi:MAG: hypothetical protein K2I18_01460 [Paramuribaculum sp.]|nr:hypothetical protein [Paramuribaculum sp.]
MENPMLIWYIVVGCVLLVFFIQFISAIIHKRHGAHHRHIIGTYREHEIFFVPGDRIIKDEDDDFEEL